MENKEGQKVPEVTFKARENGDWKDITSSDLFKGKKVVLFSLPGAFTPTCSSTHLPRYNELAKTFKENGVDEIVCMSVNDGFVMDAWGKNQDAEHVRLIPDGNGEFTEGMGMLVDKSVIGFGKRSWRYSALIEDGEVKKMFIEPEKPGDPFEVSDADTMLKFINPEAKLPPEVTVFAKPGCQFCIEAKSMLNEKGYEYEEVLLDDGISYATLRNVTGQETAPQVYIDGKRVGGLEELKEFLS